MVWSIVEGIRSNGQVIGFQDKMTCRISFIARLEKCASEGEGGSSVASVEVEAKAW